MQVDIQIKSKKEEDFIKFLQRIIRKKLFDIE